ncbi:LTA synthase family protein [Komagataeibacter medellinensis]|uniref:LTA synthase family protein n=2 Tax=Komagataeibacter medellinensis TaxID=1177712 RepID=A0ABQ6VY30_9PROT|nr:LTA synthase family protein [Komagataeibacter medellinensis]
MQQGSTGNARQGFLLMHMMFFLSVACILIVMPFIELAGIRTGGSGKAIPPRRVYIDILCALFTVGLLLALTGNPVVSLLVAVLFEVIFVSVSNIKYKILGEPLLFSDLFVARSFLQHPKFYLFSIPWYARVFVVVFLLFLVVGAFFFVVPDIRPHLVGIAMTVLGLLGIHALPAARWVPTPALEQDLQRFGLPGITFLYWRQWKASPIPPAVPPLPGSAAYDAVVVIQCESFADPACLPLPASVGPVAMPGLTQARRWAVQQGELQVSGFGAYTMRSEYGVLYGRTEAELGFRAFDPFLTAMQESSYALPNRLKGAGYESVFVHPHDIRFYNRNLLMPACGFGRMIGPEAYGHTASADMPYVSDMALGKSIETLVRSASGPIMVHAVTMENHGPWAASSQPAQGLANYLRHLGNSDRMLLDLMHALSGMDRNILLVFYGDHRPSIPGVFTPGAARDVPYVAVSLPAGRPDDQATSPPVALSPAGLHALIVQLAVKPA